MSSKYYVWGEGRWREVCLETGAVEGWGPVQFVHRAEGEMRVAKRRDVLAGLRALAADPAAAGCVTLGPPLQQRQRRRRTDQKRERDKERRRESEKTHSRARYSRATSDVYTDAHSFPVKNNVPKSRPAPKIQDSKFKPPFKSICKLLEKIVAKKDVPSISNKPQDIRTFVSTLLQKSDDIVQRQDTDAEKSSSDKLVQDSEKIATTPDGGRSMCKELVIEESSVCALRGFLRASGGGPKALRRFDNEPSYRRALFYAITPLVRLERCDLTTTTLRLNKDPQVSDASKPKGEAPGAGVLLRARHAPPPVFRPSRRGCRAGVVEYSAGEDQAIIAWLRMEGRAQRVNGNTLWQTFEPVYKNITGIARTWHSLRNRYLRHILPGLHARAVSPHTAAKLRAAAATGTTKKSTNNSIFERSPTRSASARIRPRPSARDEPAQGTSAPSKRPRSPPSSSQSPSPPPPTKRLRKLFTQKAA